jgi:glutathione synthase/RimK-type ligase-like ATP-grasp enzyme
MILLCGIPSEPPLAMVSEQVRRLGVPYVLFNQRHFADMAIEFEITGSQVTGRLQLAGRDYRLESFCGVYTRLMDDQSLPELADIPPDTPQRQYCRGLHDALIRWCEITPARVVNRTAPMSSNFSKPYQAQLIRAHGFSVPETLITNDPALVRVFRQKHQRVIYKSMSGIRSIVQTLEEDDFARLELIRWCPTQFQAFVEGTNVRVHVVGTEVYATAISTDATDYRYAHRQGSQVELYALTLPDALAEQCVTLARALGLAFAGIDLKITPEQHVYCFEVNPSPAFSYYEAHTGQPIAQAVARYLANDDLASGSFANSGALVAPVRGGSGKFQDRL